MFSVRSGKIRGEDADRGGLRAVMSCRAIASCQAEENFESVVDVVGEMIADEGRPVLLRADGRSSRPTLQSLL